MATNKGNTGNGHSAWFAMSGPSSRAMYDVATAAVEAALNAGASYADARVMETRTEAMAARNGASRASTARSGQVSASGP